MIEIPEFGNQAFEDLLGDRFKSFVEKLPQAILTKMDGDVLLMFGTKWVAQLSVSETHTWSAYDEKTLHDHWEKFA